MTRAPAARANAARTAAGPHGASGSGTSKARSTRDRTADGTSRRNRRAAACHRPPLTRTTSASAGIRSTRVGSVAQ